MTRFYLNGWRSKRIRMDSYSTLGGMYYVISEKERGWRWIFRSGGCL